METRLMSPLDPVHAQEKKIAKIHNEITKVESQMMKQASIINRLEHLQEVEDKRTQRIMERLGKRKYVINEEVERLYGKDPSRRYNDSPVESAVVEDIIQHRNKEHALAQEEAALRMKYLNIERQRLQDARERLRERRNNLVYAPSPVGSDVLEANEDIPRDLIGVDTPSEHSVHSASSNVRHALDDLPFVMDRIYKLREDLRVEYETKKRPYNGELGLESYANWQLDDYLVVRKLVENFVDEFLIRHIKPGNQMYEQEMRHAMVDMENEEWERAAGALSERRAVTLSAEELILLVTSELAREVALDTMHIFGTFHNFTSGMIFNTVERISTDQERGRDPQDPAYNLVTKSYFTYQSDRNSHRKEIWSHTQHQQHINKPPPQRQSPPQSQSKPQSKPPSQQKPPPRNQPQQQTPPVQEEEEEEEEDIDPDVEVISYDHLSSMSLRKHKPTLADSEETKLRKEHIQIYHKKELEYWKGMDTEITKLSIGKKCHGLLMTKVSPDDHFWAIGTVHGDVIVYDTWTVPWRPIRVVHNIDNADDGVVDIVWSLDNSKLCTINKGGMVMVWSFDGGGVMQSDVRGLDIQADSNGYLPHQLARVAVLDVDQDDFVFQQGPFSEQGVLSTRHSPVKGAFFPSFTLLGTQHCVCVGLGNGDMLKCNLEHFSSLVGGSDGVEDTEATCIYKQNIYDENSGVNLIGQNIEADLFRGHKHQIIFIGFIDNISNIVTVDVKGFINLWKYDRQHLSGFGWYQPQKKYKLQMSKVMYSPSSTEKPNVKFTDKIRSLKRTRQDVARERRKMEHSIEQMQLGDPWHETSIDDRGVMASIYAPKGGVKDSGAMFHVILRYKATNQLSSYVTRMYRPVKVNCTKIIQVQQSDSGQELVFLLLFPEYPPKDAHLTVLVLDLRMMVLRDFRQDILLRAEEYQNLVEKNSVACDISRVVGPTGSDYLFLMLNGRLRIMSLNTGQIVLKSDDVSRFSFFAGLEVDERQVPVHVSSEVVAVCSKGRVFAVMYSKVSTFMYVLEVKDHHTHDSRRMMVKAYQTGHDTKMAASEIRVDPVAWQQTDLKHKEAEMRDIVLEAVEDAIAWRDNSRPTESQKKEQAKQNHAQLYKTLLRQVESTGLLEGKSPEQWRQMRH